MNLSEIDLSKLSPMMKQYIDIKSKNENRILFFRLGDFYEMFFEDALIVSRELELTLTGRDCGLEERAPMCGVPFHSSEVYLKKLIEKGYDVAICEQTSDPALSKGLVTREVIRIVTRGTIIESNMLDENSNNYLCCIYYKDNYSSICFSDISTGEVHLYEFSDKNINNLIIQKLSQYAPVEIIIQSSLEKQFDIMSFIKNKIKCSVQKFDDDFYANLNKNDVLKQFNVNNFKELSINEDEISVVSICCLFSYIANTQKTLIGRFTKINIHKSESVMKLSVSTKRNLELCETMRNKEKKGSLLWVLDYTKTSMGKRLLKTFIEQPLVNPAKIIDRHNAVEDLISNPVVCSELEDCLSNVYDLERLMTKVMYKTATPRDLKAIALTTEKLPEIKQVINKLDSKLLLSLNDNIDELTDVSNLIENSIVDEPPMNFKDGGVIKDGFNNQLDELRDIINGGKGLIEKIEQSEKEKTGIKNLKIGNNRIFGYYIEVTKSNYNLIPDYYIRKQTLTNCERFITEELKKAENSMLSAKDKIGSLEIEIFNEVRDFVAKYLKQIQETASALAYLDVLVSFSKVAVNNNYSKPELAVDGIINIKKGRHPVVELMQNEELFVPNDVYLDLTDNKMMIITGPNMSGKSTYMRQVALITLMAQIGSYVPCEYAKISVVDQIFTRIGASDDLSSGQSTFMVEMSEVAEIVNNATRNSLVILDEIGRGTSTFDGISIAKAVSEYIATSKNIGCKTMFATHYHELIELENKISGIRNYSVYVKRTGRKIKFLRKIVRGGVDESYGIEVAKLAGLPNKILDQAQKYLDTLEIENKQKSAALTKADQVSFSSINDTFVLDKLRKTNIDELDNEELRHFVNDLIKDL